MSIMTMIKFPTRKIKLKIGCIIIILIGVFKISGLHLYLMEQDFSNFEYPIYGDIYPYVMQLRSNEKPTVDPINIYNYTFISPHKDKCKHEYKLRFVLIIKSALSNFQARSIIRSSWGYEKRFSDVPMRTVFLLGISERPNEFLQQAIETENKIHNDIVQANFHDKYFNNTIKTMMGFKWAVTFCENSKYFVFIDDDVYISVKNLLRFIRNPSHYPEYVEEYLQQTNPKVLASKDVRGKGQADEVSQRKMLQIDMDYELPDDAILYAGHVFVVKPLRCYLSKWYMSLNEYPFDRWPPYISAGAYVLSKEALQILYSASFFVKHFRFDDIYLSILAKKLGIQPYHSDYFYYSKPSDFKYAISYHNDYGSIQEMYEIWTEQKAAGNA